MLSRRDIGAFIGEISRRRVFRVAAWYAAAAFAVLQLTDITLPLVGLDEGAGRVVLAVILLAAPFTVALAWIFDITPQGVQRTEPRVLARDVGAVPATPVNRGGKSIVVLPFSDLSGGHDNGYLADGVTEDIIAALTCCARDMRVISRTSAMQYRDSAKPRPEIAAELGVAHVLEGSIRRVGDQVRIVAQLVEARTDEHIWAETYDRKLDNIFAIQSEVAQCIAHSLKAEISSGARALLERRSTQRMDAYDAYLRGRHLWNQRTERSIRQGIMSLRDALAADPDFALAWAALAEVHVTLAMYGLVAPADAMPPARQAAERALALDSDLIEARTPLAAVRLHYDWDWDGAEAEYGRAIEGNPRYATAHHWYANLLAAAARFDEARLSLSRARELDPVSPAVLTSAGIISYFERDMARAQNELEQVVLRYPAFPLAHIFLGLVHLQSGDGQAANAQLYDAVQLSGSTPESRAALACSLATFGQQHEARTLLHGLRNETYVSPVLYAHVLTALGEHDAALDRIAAAIELRASDLVWLGVRPSIDPLRESDRFNALLQPVFGSRFTRERSRSRAPLPGTEVRQMQQDRGA
jgi:TolB-like protein/Tfp pilus assembly protein PilF